MFFVLCRCSVKDRYGDRANDSGSESSESSSDDSEVVSVQPAPSFLICSLCQQGEAVYNDPCHSLTGTGPFFGKGLLSNAVSAEEEGP